MNEAILDEIREAVRLLGYNENGDTTKFTGRRLYKILQETAGAAAFR